MEDKKKLDWKSALEIFSRVSGWVVVPVVLALIFGKMLDRHFDTYPWIFLSLTGVAFIFSTIGIVRTVSAYIKKIEKENLWQKQQKQTQEKE